MPRYPENDTLAAKLTDLERRIKALETTETTFMVASGTRRLTVGTTAPASPGLQDVWIDLTVPALKVWYGSSWTTI